MGSRVLIIGGGISGTAAAYELARNGIGVTLLERGDLASMASGWTPAGVRQSGRHPAELPLAAAAVARWTNLAGELGADTEYRQQGNVRLALSEEDVPTIKGVVEASTAAGIEIRYLDSIDDIHALAPALCDEIYGASYCPTDGHANPTKTVLAFAEAAKRHGADMTGALECDRGSLPAVGKRGRDMQSLEGILIDLEKLLRQSSTCQVWIPRLSSPEQPERRHRPLRVVGQVKNHRKGTSCRAWTHAAPALND